MAVMPSQYFVKNTMESPIFGFLKLYVNLSTKSMSPLKMSKFITRSPFLTGP